MFLNHYTTLIFTIVILSTQLYAHISPQDEVRKRVHSPRKAIDSVAKIEQKEISIVGSMQHMFSDAKVSGQIKSIYADYNYKKDAQSDTYTTAIGGIIKYELASLYGFNAAAAVYTSHDLNFATGTDIHQNPELSSKKGYYTEMAEAYLNYKYNDFNFRAGRQTLDTPLADSDDIRMIQNTFEAYIATYNLNGFKFMAGNIQHWQGYDAGLEEPWSKTGKNGTNLVGVKYHNKLELSAWYYNITGVTNAFYIDGGVEYPFSKDVTLHAMVQYLHESELDKSSIQSSVYGALLELVFHGIGFNISYDKALQKMGKKSFSGTGGGTLFTSMDTMILDNIAQDSDAEAIVGGFTYDYHEFGLLYAYGDFSSDSEHMKEQDIGAQYNVNDEFLVAGVYAIENDRKHKQKTDYDWNRFQLLVNYNF